MNNSPKRVLGRFVVIGLAASLVACGSNKIAMRGCDLDHPYHQLAESAPLQAPEGLDVPRESRTYQLPKSDKLAPQPSNFLTPGDLEKLESEELNVADCLSHPPKYDTPVDVEGQDLSGVKKPRKPRKIEKSDGNEEIGGGRGGADRGQQGAGYPR